MKIITCWKCRRKSEQEYDYNCSWCGAYQKEKDFQQNPCPLCDIGLESHSRIGALSCLLEIKNKFNLTVSINCNEELEK